MLRNRFFTTLIGLGLAVAVVFTARTGLASSRLATSKAALAEAMVIYHQSEWASVEARPAVSREGLAIYHNSEWGTATGLSAEGLAIYKQSEHASPAVQPAWLGEVGLAVYHASEWDRPLHFSRLPKNIAHPGR